MSQPNGDGDGGTGPLPPPPGTIPLFLQMKSMDKYGMKTGENIEDVVPYMFFNRDEILDEIAKMGFMCDFDPCKDKIAAYPEEEFLVMGDPEQKYGDSWLLCYTIEAKDAIFAAEKAAQEAREAEERRIAEEEARKKAEIEAKLNAVYEDKPIDASPWCSESKEETFNDIQCTSVNANRPPIGLTICRPRGSFLKPLKMADRDVGMDGVLEFRSHKDIAYDVVNVEGEIGLQVTPSTVDLATQTAWFKPVNKALQSETASAINIAKEIQTGIDKGSTKVLTVGGGKSLSRMGSNYRRGMNKGNDLDEQTLDELVDFLIKVRPLMEEALHENETVDIFSNAFTFGGDDESTLGKKGEDELKEIRAFSSLELSKNKPLSAIDWHPKRKGLIAVSPTFKLTFTERVSIDCNVYSSYILIWDFIDFSSPQFVLKSPQDIFTFRFNPSTPQIVVGGTITGQILLWDISSAIDATVSKRNKGVKGKEEEQKIPPIVPKFSSSIDVSHRKTVAELSWLPPSTQINSRGQLLSSEHLTGSTNQFVTIAGDGQVLIWDIRFEEIAEGNLPHVHKPKVQQLYDKKGEKISIPWTPLFRLQLKQPERVGDIPLCKLALSYPGEENISTPNKVDEANQSKILLGTEEGELLQIDWRAIANFVDSSGEDGKDSGASEVTAIEWIEADHTRPCKGVQKSPFFNDLYVTMGDWSFRIWKADSQRPVYTSPASSSYLSCVRWSISRPAVLLIGKVDGSLDVWDFADTSYKPSMTLTCGPSLITSMEFLKASLNPSKQQLLAVGDDTGNLHIFDLPRSLIRSLPNEKIVMKQFLDRELKRLDYTETRKQLRDKEAEIMEQAKELALSQGQEIEGKADDDLDFHD